MLPGTFENVGRGESSLSIRGELVTMLSAILDGRNGSQLLMPDVRKRIKIFKIQIEWIRQTHEIYIQVTLFVGVAELIELHLVAFKEVIWHQVQILI